MALMPMQQIPIHWSSTKDDNANPSVLLSGDVVWQCWCFRKTGTFERFIDCQRHVTAHSGWQTTDEATA